MLKCKLDVLQLNKDRFNLNWLGLAAVNFLIDGHSCIESSKFLSSCFFLGRGGGGGGKGVCAGKCQGKKDSRGYMILTAMLKS